jgi:hypothetical protein
MSPLPFPPFRLAGGSGRGTCELQGNLEPGACLEAAFTLDVLKFGDVKVRCVFHVWVGR